MIGFAEQVFKVSLELLNFWSNSRTCWLPKNLHSCQVIIFIWFLLHKIRNSEFIIGFIEQVFKVSFKLLNFWTNSRTSWLPKNLHSCQVIIFIWFLLHQLESRCFSLSHDAVRPVEHKRFGFYTYGIAYSRVWKKHSPWKIWQKE